MAGHSEEMRRRLEAVLDALRPGLLRDGGNAEILSVGSDGTVKLELQGRCATCPAQSATIHEVLEPAFREALEAEAVVVPVAGDPTPLPE